MFFCLTGIRAWAAETPSSVTAEQLQWLKVSVGLWGALRNVRMMAWRWVTVEETERVWNGGESKHDRRSLQGFWENRPVRFSATSRRNRSHQSFFFFSFPLSILAMTNKKRRQWWLSAKCRLALLHLFLQGGVCVHNINDVIVQYSSCLNINFQPEIGIPFMFALSVMVSVCFCV